MDGFRKQFNDVNHDGIATDPLSQLSTRRSMQLRRSIDDHRMSIESSDYSSRGDRQGLIRAYDEENIAGFGLQDLAEESDEDIAMGHINGRVNGGSNKNMVVNDKRRSTSNRLKPGRVEKLPSR